MCLKEFLSKLSFRRMIHDEWVPQVGFSQETFRVLSINRNGLWRSLRLEMADARLFRRRPRRSFCCVIATGSSEKDFVDQMTAMGSRRCLRRRARLGSVPISKG